jgi:hypothetical protein
LIEIWEDKNEGNDEHVVNSEQSDQEVPRLAEGSLRVDEIPLELGVLTVLLMVGLIIVIVVDVINHHFLQVCFGHLLKFCLDPQLIVITSGLVPKVLQSFFLLLWALLSPLLDKDIVLVTSSVLAPTKDSADPAFASTSSFFGTLTTFLGFFEF